MDQLLQILLWVLLTLTEWIRPILVPLCFVVAWSLVALTVWQLVAVTRDGMKRAQVMHQIPCAECRYFTNNHLLKCPLHPKTALSEAAIDCTDYETNNLINL
ncbi:MAG: hypothetical protein HC929_03655 [Leptolyngbyaceae cyanobacterium SM2_5_2]|nr:hypothetical protein [Leptolyngbyaceae cyanobacterium SM2_5_2]